MANKSNRSNGGSEARNKARRKMSRNNRINKNFDSKAKLDSTERDNDPNWYFTSSEMANQAAELSFQQMIDGSPLVGNYSIPALAIIKMNPSPGVNYNITSMPGSQADAADTLPSSSGVDKRNGINLMSAKIYTLLSTFSGRTSSYAPQDVGTMILAISSIAELSEHIRRAFGLLFTYNTRNRYMPLQVIEAVYGQAKDFMANSAIYRQNFNVQMTRINQIPLLDNIGYIRKSREIYQKLYVDEPSAMAQMFIYRPDSVWYLDETSYQGGTVLRTMPLQSGISALISQLASMIDRVLESSTLNIVYADLLNLATKMNVPTWQFDYLAENYVVMPEYNRTAVLQFHNLDWVGQPTNQPNGSGYGDTIGYITKGGFNITSNNDVIPDPNENLLMYCPAFLSYVNTTSYLHHGRNGSNFRKLVDMDTDSPSLEDRIEALRFGVMRSGYKYITSSSTATNNRFNDVFLALPDHYPVSIAMVYGMNPTSSNPYGVKTRGLNRSNAMCVADWYTYAIISNLSQFKNHPFFYILENPTGSNDPKVDGVTGDMGFVTTVDYEYLNRLNRIMYTGLFEFRV